MNKKLFLTFRDYIYPRPLNGLVIEVIQFVRLNKIKIKRIYNPINDKNALLFYELTFRTKADYNLFSLVFSDRFNLDVSAPDRIFWSDK